MSIKRCVICALPDTYPGVKFDGDGICNYCAYHDMYKEREKRLKNLLRRGFINVIKETKKASKGKKHDCVIAYSGGKDSTFLLLFLKKRFNLRILAHTLDNGFTSKKAMENIRKITKKLGVDHKFTRPKFEVIKDVFSSALKGEIPYSKDIRAMLSPVCAACLGMVCGTTLNLCIKLKIPLMFIGFTPGQYPAISLENFLKSNSCLFLSDKIYKDDPLDVVKMLRDPIDERFGEKAGKYFFKSQYIEKGLKVPRILLPYHNFIDYDEKRILMEISKIGWEKPSDTDPCSTNCLLNTLGNYSCMKQFGYHPYIGEMSLMVRRGKMSRIDAIKAEQTDDNSFAMRDSLSLLGIKKIDLEKK